MRATKKEIDEIIRATPKELDDKITLDFYPEIIGYYRPSNANWSYQVGVITYKQKALVVVFQFGHIVAR